MLDGVSFGGVYDTNDTGSSLSSRHTPPLTTTTTQSSPVPALARHESSSVDADAWTAPGCYSHDTDAPAANLEPTENRTMATQRRLHHKLVQRRVEKVQHHCPITLGRRLLVLAVKVVSALTVLSSIEQFVPSSFKHRTSNVISRVPSTLHDSKPTTTLSVEFCQRYAHCSFAPKHVTIVPVHMLSVIVYDSDSFCDSFCMQ